MPFNNVRKVLPFGIMGASRWPSRTPSVMTIDRVFGWNLSSGFPLIQRRKTLAGLHSKVSTMANQKTSAFCQILQNNLGPRWCLEEY